MRAEEPESPETMRAEEPESPETGGHEPAALAVETDPTLDPLVAGMESELATVTAELDGIEDPRPESDRLHREVAVLIDERRKTITDIDRKLSEARQTARTYLNDVCVPTEGRRDRLRIRAQELREAIERHRPKV